MAVVVSSALYVNLAVIRCFVLQLCMCKYQIRNKLVVVKLFQVGGCDGAHVTCHQFSVLALPK